MPIGSSLSYKALFCIDDYWISWLVIQTGHGAVGAPLADVLAIMIVTPSKSIDQFIDIAFGDFPFIRP